MQIERWTTGGSACRKPKNAEEADVRRRGASWHFKHPAVRSNKNAWLVKKQIEGQRQAFWSNPKKLKEDRLLGTKHPKKGGFGRKTWIGEEVKHMFTRRPQFTFLKWHNFTPWLVFRCKRPWKGISLFRRPVLVESKASFKVMAPCAKYIDVEENARKWWDDCSPQLPRGFLLNKIVRNRKKWCNDSCINFRIRDDPSNMNYIHFTRRAGFFCFLRQWP